MPTWVVDAIEAGDIICVGGDVGSGIQDQFDRSAILADNRDGVIIVGFLGHQTRQPKSASNDGAVSSYVESLAQFSESPALNSCGTSEASG
jgi:hypothetical protein